MFAQPTLTEAGRADRLLRHRSEEARDCGSEEQINTKVTVRYVVVVTDSFCGGVVVEVDLLRCGRRGVAEVLVVWWWLWFSRCAVVVVVSLWCCDGGDDEADSGLCFAVMWCLF